MNIKKIMSDNIDSYLSKNGFIKFIENGYIKDDKRIVDISKFDTEEYWIRSYTHFAPNGNYYKANNLSQLQDYPSVLTKEELYGFYMKVRFLNDGKYKLKPYIIVDEEIKNLGYILDADAYPHSLVYKKYDMDGSESLRVIIYRDSDFNCHVLKAETADDNPMELNERELRAFHKKMNQISKDWERDYKITQNLRSRLLFE